MACGDFMMNLRKYGLKLMRQRNDVRTQHDFKNMLLVWAFQFCVNFFVILATDADLKGIYED